MIDPDEKDERTVRKDVQDLLKASSSLQANFVVIAGQDIGRKFPIEKSELSIGRGDNSDISINDEDVSRNHAQVFVTPAGIILKDLGSTNGTLVNGNTMTSKHLLEDGDRVQFGNTTVLKFNFFNELEDNYNEQLYMAANKDFLTGCYNKKYFLDRLNMEISHTKRHNTPLTLIMFDIDHFKKLNDAHGHVTGDLILKQLAEHISSIKRHEDLFARYGGEEFVILLRETKKETAIQIAEKIRKGVEDLHFNIDDTEDISVTISVGLETCLGEDDYNPESFLRATDEQLYTAKRDGRNQVKYRNAA